MIEFVVGKRYVVGHSFVGLLVGRFTGTDPKGGLKFADVTEFVDVAKGEEYVITAAGIVDAEPWVQSIELVNYAEVHVADEIARELSRRKSINVARCKKVTSDE